MWLDKVNIAVLGVVVEQSPHLVMLKSSMVPVVVPLEVHSVETLQVSLVLIQWVVQVNLGLVALWEIGLA